MWRLRRLTQFAILIYWPLKVIKQDAHQLVGQAKRRTTKIRPKAVGCGIFGRFSSFDKCRLEVAGDVVSGANVGQVGTDIPVKLGDSRLNRS